MSATLFVIYIPVEDEDNNSESSEIGDKDEKVNEKSDQSPSDQCEPAAGLPSTEVDSLLDVSAKGSFVLTEKAEEEPLLNDVFAPDAESVSKFSVTKVQEPIPNEESESKDNNSEEDNEEEGFEEVELITIAQALEAILKDLGVEHDTWTKSDNQSFIEVCFVMGCVDTDRVLKRLAACGIGQMDNTSVSLFPANFHSAGLMGSIQSSSDGQNKSDDESSEFLRSVKSRLTVAQVQEAIRSNAQLTFDYIMLVTLASIIAGLGLAENSSVVLVASMLVSPLMGPIMGGTFGVVIGNENLMKLGIVNEIIGLGICLFVGLLFGVLTSLINMNGVLWGGSTQWPTVEMASRGHLRSLWVGVLIAVPSGAGVALSILGGNAGSLVGVAISASLLPPAVNAGMLWANALITALHPLSAVPSPTSPTIPPFNNFTFTQENSTDYVPTSSADVVNHGEVCAALVDNTYEFVYSCNMASESVILGTLSLLLTLLNIACIFIMGVLVLKLKEVAPHTAVSDATERFWKKDIKVARDTYKTVKTKTDRSNADLANEAKRIAKELKEKLSEEENPYVVQNEWKRFIQGVGDDSGYNSVTSQIGARPTTNILRTIEEEGNHFIQESYSPDAYLDNYFTVQASSTHSRPQSIFLNNGQAQKVPMTAPISSTPFHFPTQIRQRRRSAKGPAHNKPPQKMKVKKSTSGRFNVTTHTDPTMTPGDSPKVHFQISEDGSAHIQL